MPWAVGIELERGRDVFVGDGVKGFAEAAAGLLRDGGLRGRLAHNGYDTIRRKYSWTCLAQRFEELYSEVIAEPRSNPQPSELVLDRPLDCPIPIR